MPRTDETSTEALDRSVLVSLRELQEKGEPDIVTEVGGLFLKYAPDKIFAIETAVKTSDTKALRVAAHSLKSSSAYVGALRLSAVSRELEEMGRAGIIENAAEKVEELKIEYRKAKSSLEKELEYPC
ncbi:MAG: Hpt domain-containing protein [Methanotrichaceae archaeon]|nr:Hpt domain-containing protein [Methanotrichaceae archaeon]